MSAPDFYQTFLRPLLFSLAPETAHHLAMRALRLVAMQPALLARLRSYQPAPVPVELFGLRFPNAIGLAAGFDKNGVALPAWEALGFGSIEIGTVTAKAQPGNPRPRIFRYPAERALINRLGFNNDGAEVVARRLEKLRERGGWPRIPVGINIGKSKVTPLENAVDDYRQSFRLLQPLADYVVLNVSSPNTPGLRSLQSEEALVRLLGAMSEENTAAPKPLLVKIAPDLSLGELDQVVAAAHAHGVSGLIATNTTLDHSSIASARDESGGLSGAPLREKSTALLRALRSRTALPIIGVGGIFDVASAREKIEAGANLLQIYTGYIYRGPGLLREVVEGTARALDRQKDSP